MKRNILWMGMLAIILTFGMTVVGCGDDSTDDNGGGIAPLTWTRSASTPWGGYDSRAVAYGGDKFVVVGGWNSDGSYTAYSTDKGVTWTTGGVNTASQSTSAIAYGGGRFVTNTSYSADGIAWTKLSSSSSGRAGNAIIYDGNKFVAVGNVFSNGVNTGTGIASSTNGQSWSNVTNSVFVTNDSVNGIAYSGSKYVVGGSNGKMAYSTDGIAWTAVTNSTFGNTAINGIAYGAGKFVAVGESGKMAYSADGIAWTAVTNSAFGSRSIRVIAYGGGRFVAAGNGGAAYSSDGATWTETNISAGTNGFHGIAYGGGRFVVVGTIGGDTGRMAYSNALE